MPCNLINLGVLSMMLMSKKLFSKRVTFMIHNILSRYFLLDIRLFRSIIVFCGTNNIWWNIPHIHYECEEYSTRKLSVPQNIFMDMYWVIWKQFNSTKIP